MMLSLKKVYRDELLQIAILLSLLRVEPNEWSARVPAIGVGGPDAWEYSPRDIRVHPKSLLVDDQQVLSELSSLGRYNRVANLWQNVTAYMGLTNNDDEVASTSRGDTGEPSDWGYVDENHDDDLLTPEDMDLIEVLWKQDVDMGFSIQEWQESASAAEDDSNPLKDDSSPLLSKKEKLSLPPDKFNYKEKKNKKEEDEETKEEKEDKDRLNGVSYTVDLETGEYIVKEESDRRDELSEDEPPSSLLPEPEFSLEEALQLVGLNDDLQFLEGGGIEREESEASVSESSSSGSPSRLTEELDLLEEMIHGPAYPPPHHRPIQGRMGYMRGGSMEQRWQDLASLLSLPEPHYLSGYPQEHKPAAGLPMPHQEHHAVTPYSPMGSGNVGSAVASSMNLMTNASEPMGSEAGVTAFKMENTHDMMYYQNGTSEINHNSDGFLSSILNDDDLQLMDMAMNEAAGPGMYTMRMLEGASGGGDSDSAVSSMGSERVPSLSSDNEWMETNSDSGQAAGDHYQEYSRSKYRWYDYGYGRQLSGEASSLNHSRGQPPVAQKKHHMYGKRIFHDQAAGGVVGGGNVCSGGVPLKSEYPPNMSPAIAPNYPLHPELKYSCSVEFSRQALSHPGVRSTPSQIAAHNHTYHMLPEDCGSQQRPLARDKKGRKSEEEAHLTRDERRARALNIPIPVEDIINLPMDEFNERLSKYDLSETQLSLIRDIRRRGKNKVAAQNCRKRKLDQILSLADEVKQMRERKQRLLHERQVLLSERHRMKSKFSQLYRHIFQSLRDPEGNPYSPYEWTLQQSTDGSVVLVPQNNRTMSGNQTMLDQTDSPARKPHNP